MSTRATIRFAERKSGQSFAEQPKEWYAQFYKHSDGYPEGLGLDIANSFFNGTKLTNWEAEHIDTVHGECPHCHEDTLLVAIVTDYYKCTMCGQETRQYINGSIKYLKLDERDRDFIQKTKELDEKDG